MVVVVSGGGGDPRRGGRGGEAVGRTSPSVGGGRRLQLWRHHSKLPSQVKVQRVSRDLEPRVELMDRKFALLLLLPSTYRVVATSSSSSGNWRHRTLPPPYAPSYCAHTQSVTHTFTHIVRGWRTCSPLNPLSSLPTDLAGSHSMQRAKTSE